jgi:alkylation response protein AidB-like acyl-CoA dehydrogenase
MYPGLLHGAVETLQAHAHEALRARYLPKLVSGEWLAAMALTEPDAGSDLGLVRTMAAPRADGSVAVTGDKLFISGGDHDLADNIVHLVLCRLRDAPPGTKGLSLALVPKRLPDGTRNAMRCTGLEHKMGIHGSATCAMRYDGATGWLVGAPGRGLAAMFVMMNAARLHVGLQGLGHLEMAGQNARRHAHERRQMRAAVPPEGAERKAADPIAWHPAMRRTLLDLQATAEGLRVVAYRAALRLDEAAHHPDPARRERASSEAALLTPVLKAFATRLGFEGASAALQVFGGYGYVRATGIEQTVRDARIALVYEGTNEIQAIDLLGRKVLGAAGPAFDGWLDDLARDADDGDAGRALAAQLRHARAAAAALRERVQHDPEAPLRVADDFLAGIGHLLLAWAWAVSARAAARTGQGGDPAWRRERAAIARHGIAWVLPQSEVHWQRVAAAAPLQRVPAA